jgi:hypothetical protein
MKLNPKPETVSSFGVEEIAKFEKYKIKKKKVSLHFILKTPQVGNECSSRSTFWSFEL